MPRAKSLSDAIHACMVDILGLPDGKRAQRFVPLDEAGFFAPSDRSRDYVVIEVHMMEGRQVETKKALIRELFRRIQADVGIAPIDVEITLMEQPAHCWGFRGMTGDEAKLDYSIDV